MQTQYFYIFTDKIMENKKEMDCHPHGPKGCCDKEAREEKMENFKEPKYFIICDEKMTPIKIMRIAIEHGMLKHEKLHLKNGKDAQEKIEQRKKLYS